MPTKTKAATKPVAPLSALGKILEENREKYLKIPKKGDVVNGKVVSLAKNEIRIDVEGMSVGVVRGKELFAESDVYSDLKVNDPVESTVLDMENENGEMELSFRFAGQQRAWNDLREFFTSGKPVEIKITDANKGGLMARVHHVMGFLPVSQLSPDNYPRVAGGDKGKILEKLRSFIGKTFEAKVIDIDEKDEKLILSEKSVWEEKQKSLLERFKVGDTVEGKVVAIADFGVFVRFDSLEGLVHISEIAWQRIEHPKDVVKVGDTVKAQIIDIEGSKIFLSMKNLVTDPWADVMEKYKVGSIVEGKVLKVNPFGLFVELDPNIHGLAHISELSLKPIKDATTIAKIGDTKKFKIISLEPKEHRLGLSIKAMEMDENPAAAAEVTKEAEAKKEDSKEEKPKKVAKKKAAKTEEKSEEKKAE
ncbi:MAG: S1 RNA-binding domain-containing protein [bacterium]